MTAPIEHLDAPPSSSTIDSCPSLSLPRRSSQRPCEAPGILDDLRRLDGRLIRWCTPSVLPGPGLDAYREDLSISYQPAGSMLDHSGWFGNAEAEVAATHGVDRALLMTTGSTGANQVVMRALALRASPGAVLVDRQAHHSVIRSLEMFGVSWQYLDRARWDDTFECPRPTAAQDLAESIASAGEVAAVVLVSPTYNGETVDLTAVRAVLDEAAPDAVLHIDEAWGAHLAFHPELRRLSAAGVADTVSQSTHKAGGALQPGAVLLWNDRRMPFEILDEAYQDLTSTSASFLIAGSVQRAHRILARDGRAIIDHSISVAAALARGLRRELPGAALLSDARAAEIAGAEIWCEAAAAGGLDPTKVTVALPPGAITGYAMAEALAQRYVVVEKATPATITFLTTFGLDESDADQTSRIAGQIYRRLRAAAERTARSARPRVTDPFAAMSTAPLVDPARAQRRRHHDAVSVPLVEAVGSVSCGTVEAYPPGVAVISPGFVVTASAVEWLRAISEAGGVVLGLAPDGSLPVLPP